MSDHENARYPDFVSEIPSKYILVEKTRALRIKHFEKLKYDVNLLDDRHLQELQMKTSTDILFKESVSRFGIRRVVSAHVYA